MIDVKNELRTYPDEGRPTAAMPDRVWIESHGIFRDRVVLMVGETKVILLASDLHAAITNATNTAR